MIGPSGEAALAPGGLEVVGVAAVGDGLADAVGECRDLDHRAAERARHDRGERGAVRGDRVDVLGDVLDVRELHVELRHRVLRLAEDRRGAFVGLADRESGLVEGAAELEQRDGEQQDEHRERDRGDECRDGSSGHQASESMGEDQSTLSGHSGTLSPRMSARNRASRSPSPRSAPRSAGW